jgi:hypothetical protein
MKMLMNVRIPHEPFNTLVREGTVGEIIRRILDDLKPESIYFTEQGGTRGAVAIIDVDDSSRIPSFSEPFFLHFNLTNWERNGAKSRELIETANIYCEGEGSGLSVLASNHLFQPTNSIRMQSY